MQNDYVTKTYSALYLLNVVLTMSSGVSELNKLSGAQMCAARSGTTQRAARKTRHVLLSRALLSRFGLIQYMYVKCTIQRFHLLMFCFVIFFYRELLSLTKSSRNEDEIELIAA